MEESAPKTAKASSIKPLIGTVLSAGGSKTIRVVVDNLVKHARYGKYMRRHTKVAAHDENNTAAVGDKVEIVPCRRMSKSKSYRFVRVVRPAAASE